MGYNRKRMGQLFVLSILIFMCCAVWAAVNLQPVDSTTNAGAMSREDTTNFLLPAELAKVTVPEWIDVQFIQKDGASRRGITLDGLKDIVIHYIGNPGTTAKQNHKFYNNKSSNVSSHFIVGMDGEIIQCLPLNEVSSASNERNKDTVSIEVCHPDDTGQFTDKTYQSLVRLTAWLCNLGKLKTNHVIRHYDITGKECPRYYVRNEDKWDQFLNDVEDAI